MTKGTSWVSGTRAREPCSLIGLKLTHQLLEPPRLQDCSKGTACGCAPSVVVLCAQRLCFSPCHANVVKTKLIKIREKQPGTHKSPFSLTFTNLVRNCKERATSSVLATVSTSLMSSSAKAILTPWATLLQLKRFANFVSGAYPER